MNITTRIMSVLLTATLALSAWTAPATAAPGQPVPSVAIELMVVLVAPDLLKVSLTYTCLPSPTTLGDVSVNVTQAVPVPSQGFGAANLTCDGAQHRVDVFVAGGPVFSTGDALATAEACTTLTCGSDARKVVIVN